MHQIDAVRLVDAVRRRPSSGIDRCWTSHYWNEPSVADRRFNEHIKAIKRPLLDDTARHAGGLCLSRSTSELEYWQFDSLRGNFNEYTLHSVSWANLMKKIFFALFLQIFWHLQARTLFEVDKKRAILSKKKWPTDRSTDQWAQVDDDESVFPRSRVTK